MKTFKILLSTILILGLNLSFAQTARVQIIHNSADAAAEVVDVWLNTTKLIENFAFRTATPYLDAPAGVLLNIGIAPPNSTSWTQSFRIKQVALTANETYVVVAGGIISTSGYTPSPIFNVGVYPIGREAASQAGNTDVLVVHGSTDAPTVDIYETGVGAGQIVNDLMYGNVAGYLELPTMNYVLEIRDETGMNTLAAYDAPLATLGLQGSAITVVASGFLNPGNNSNGPAFGLWVALPSGGPLLELPVHSMSQTARVQVIHNSADVLADPVDVYINSTLALDNFAFRTATPFIDLPSGVTLNIGVAPGNSTSVNDTLANFPVVLDANKTYVVVANGIVSASGYEPNKPFNLYVYNMGREEASMMGFTDVLIHHGSTDAPAVDIDIIANGGGGSVLDDLSYSEFFGYAEVFTSDFRLVLSSGFLGVIGTYDAPLATLGLDDAAITVVASGFLNPANNSNGPAFGLWVALADGGELVELPSDTPSQIEVVVAIPAEFSLEQNYPNPFNPSTVISFNLAVDSDVSLKVFNILGQEVVSLLNNKISAGTQQINFNASGLNSGVYFYQLEAKGIDGSNFSSTRKMLLTK